MGIIYTNKDGAELPAGADCIPALGGGAAASRAAISVVDFIAFEHGQFRRAQCGRDRAAATYRSLMDHLGSGKEWDLHTRNNGLSILPATS